MNIIYIGAFRFPYFDAAASRVLNIGKSFRAGGHNVEYIAMGGEEIEEHKQHDGIFEYQGFPYKVTYELDCHDGFLNRILAKFKRGDKIIDVLKKRNLTDSLVIAYNPGGRFIKKLMKLSRIKKFKLAVDLTEWYDRNELPLTDWYSYNRCMTHTLLEVKNKIVISSYLNDYYQGSNNIIVPATCDIHDEKWQKSIDNIESFPGLTLIYAGNPAKKDSVHTVINAVNNLANTGVNIRFILLGITRESYLNKYSHKLDTLHLSDKILFLGKVSQNEVPAYYKHADYMILLRENNRKSNAGFPTKFAESYTAGVPVIANATSDIGKFIKDGHNGYLLENENLECVESVLNKICAEYSPQIVAQQKENALKTGREIFDCNNYSVALNLFLQNLS